jgi:hypothetical protein
MEMEIIKRYPRVHHFLHLFICSILYAFFIILALCATLIFLTHFFRSPKNDRPWSLDQAILPIITEQGDTVTIQNIRNFSYASERVYTPHYYTATFEPKKIVSVDFILEPLAKYGVAHTLLSFTFSDGRRLAISAEIRKEQGETFSALRGLLNEFELMYVIADERDVLGLRAIHRNHALYRHSLNLTSEESQSLFLNMLKKAQKLHHTPEFYNTMTNTCFTNIRDNINSTRSKKLPWDFANIFPLYADTYLYNNGLISNHGNYSDLKQETYRIDQEIRDSVID